MGAKILDFIMRKNVCDPPRDSIDLVSKIGWRDMDAETLKAFFRQWESYAIESDAEVATYEDGENYTFKVYSEGYRDAVLDLIDDIGVVLARMPEPELDLDGWYK
ncbi:hypothetical protein HMPREF0388_1770 [Mobiluncus curtisii ATCC 51333]|uniref:Uncharacterized protein n=2 Tax=Mobiluncus curtisii TaxID=2051 RepID=E6M137_9ACTO|nr:hypothetical protein HMPREF0388_1770 [Mobiluncus curtisii ATCC 51333]